MRCQNMIISLDRSFVDAILIPWRKARCFSCGFSQNPSRSSPLSVPKFQKIHHVGHGRGLRVEKQDQCSRIVRQSVGSNADIRHDNPGDDLSRATLIWRAVKLPIYSVALIPLTVGGATAYMQTGVFSARRYFFLLCSSILIISWLNLSNDVYDSDTGADKNKKESVVNLVGSRTSALFAARAGLFLGFVGLVWTSIDAGNPRSILLLASAVLCGYIYQCPPFRLGYRGLGEPLCFAAFGPFATTAFYFLLRETRQTSPLSLSSTILTVSVLVGITTTLILFCSHFHQVEEDQAVGKMSPLVRLGTKRGSSILKSAIYSLYFLLLLLGLSGALPITCVILCGLTLPMGNLIINFVEENHKDKSKIFMAKYYCVRLHMLFGLALSLGLIAPELNLKARFLFNA